jgi:ABC-2 type transport system permease protein
MRDFLTVYRYELKTQLMKKSAIVTTVIIMAILLLVTSLPRIIAMFDSSTPASTAAASAGSTQDTGYVLADANLQSLLSPVLGEAVQNPYPDREALIQALREKDIQVGFVINPDLSYEAIYQDRQMSDTRDAALGETLSRVKREQLILELGLTPADFSAIESSRAEGTVTVMGRNSMENYFISFAMMLAVYMMVLLYGNGVSSVIAREKDSRTMEILITSTRPSSLILGKVAASGTAAVFMFSLLVLAGVIGFQMNRDAYPQMIMAMLSGSLTPGFIWSYVFFSFFGFILYLFLFAALGSTVSKMEDLASATGLVQFLFIAAYLLATVSAQMPDSALAIISSIVPFTSVMVMPLRCAMTTVPWGQLILAGGLMLLFVAFFAYLSIKIYRWGSLNYGNKTKLVRIVREALRRV